MKTSGDASTSHLVVILDGGWKSWIIFKCLESYEEFWCSLDNLRMTANLSGFYLYENLCNLV